MEGTKKEVYTLTETYNDGNPEVIGVYDSKRAMIRGLARNIAEEVTHEEKGYLVKADEYVKVAKKVAVVLADLIPSILGEEDWGRDEEGCCRYGKSVFGYDTMPLESVDGEDEEDEEDDE